MLSARHMSRHPHASAINTRTAPQPPWFVSALVRQDYVAARTVLAHRTDEQVPSRARRLAAGLCGGGYGHEAKAQKGQSECVHIVLQLLTCAPRNSGHRLFST